MQTTTDREPPMTAPFDELLDQIRAEYTEVSRRATLAAQAARFQPADELASIVRGQREAQGLTLQALSDLSGVSVTTISRLERGVGAIRLDSLQRLLASLGLGLWVG